MCPRTVCVEPGGLWCQSKVVVSPLEVSRLAVCVEDTPAETWNSHRDAVSDLHALQLGLSTFTKLPSCFLSGAHRFRLWISFLFVLLRGRYVARAPYRVRTRVSRKRNGPGKKNGPVLQQRAPSRIPCLPIVNIITIVTILLSFFSLGTAGSPPCLKKTMGGRKKNYAIFHITFTH